MFGSWTLRFAIVQFNHSCWIVFSHDHWIAGQARYSGWLSNALKVVSGFKWFGSDSIEEVPRRKEEYNETIYAAVKPLNIESSETIDNR